MKEITVISGKGGTGKTSITGCFAALAENAVVADCDVDAADLHMLLDPQIQETHDFISGNIAVIREEDCIGCMECLNKCRFNAISSTDNAKCRVGVWGCEGCGVCTEVCPVNAIDFPQRHCGVWYFSHTRFGPMVHARLGIAQENSGKLVSTVRRQAAKAAELEKELILVDGPPGIGCPVTASITGTSLVVIITEPTMSGLHDMTRVMDLADHFSIPAAIIVNKWDINPDMTVKIEELAAGRGVSPVGRIPYDRAFTEAQIHGRTLLEHRRGEPAENIRKIWENVCRKMR